MIYNPYLCFIIVFFLEQRNDKGRELIKLYLDIALFITSALIFLLLRGFMRAKLSGEKESSIEEDIVSVKIEEGEMVTIQLKRLEDYEKKFGKGKLIPLWDGRLSSKGYVIFFDSTEDKNCFLIGEYATFASIFGEEKLVRDVFSFDSNYVKIDIKGIDAKLMIVPA